MFSANFTRLFYLIRIALSGKVVPEKFQNASSLTGAYELHHVLQGFQGSIVDIKIKGSLLYVAHDGGLKVFDTKSGFERLDTPKVPIEHGLVNVIETYASMNSPDEGVFYGTTRGHIIAWAKTRDTNGQVNFIGADPTLWTNPVAVSEDGRGELGEVTAIRVHELSGVGVALHLSGFITVFKIGKKLRLRTIWTRKLEIGMVPMTAEFSHNDSLKPDVLVFDLSGLKWTLDIDSGDHVQNEEHLGIYVATSKLSGDTLLLGNPANGLSVCIRKNDTFRVARNVRIPKYAQNDFRACATAFLEGGKFAIGSDHGVTIVDRRTSEMVDLLAVGAKGKWTQTVAAGMIHDQEVLLMARSHVLREDDNEIYIWKASKTHKRRGTFDELFKTVKTVVTTIALAYLCVQIVAQYTGYNWVYQTWDMLLEAFGIAMGGVYFIMVRMAALLRKFAADGGNRIEW